MGDARSPMRGLRGYGGKPQVKIQNPPNPSIFTFGGFFCFFCGKKLNKMCIMYVCMYVCMNVKLLCKKFIYIYVIYSVWVLRLLILLGNRGGVGYQGTLSSFLKKRLEKNPPLGTRGRERGLLVSPSFSPFSPPLLPGSFFRFEFLFEFSLSFLFFSPFFSFESRLERERRESRAQRERVCVSVCFFWNLGI